MFFLADMGISQKTAAWLRENGHDCTHFRDQGLQTLADKLIIEKARSEGRIILTFDLDFAAIMAISNAKLPSVVILRLKNQKSYNQISKIKSILEESSLSLLNGAIISVDETNFRVRHLPLRTEKN
jgi:predicted nuclease of predicted toxin-antitoxin system